MERIQCSVHGTQDKTFVCQHIADGLIARRRVGFFWTTDDPDNPDPTLVVPSATLARLPMAENGWARPESI